MGTRIILDGLEYRNVSSFPPGIEPRFLGHPVTFLAPHSLRTQFIFTSPIKLHVNQQNRVSELFQHADFLNIALAVFIW